MTGDSQTSIRIRKLQSRDVPLYRALRLEGLKKSPDRFGTTYEEEFARPKLKFESLIERQASEQFMFGAFDEGKLIGIVGFERVERERARHRGQVVQMYVDESYRGQNVGEKLLRGLVEQAFQLKGIEQLQLSVITDNLAAIGLYEKIGFKAFGLQPRSFKTADWYMDQQFMQLFKHEYLNEKHA